MNTIKLSQLKNDFDIKNLIKTLHLLDIFSTNTLDLEQITKAGEYKIINIFSCLLENKLSIANNERDLIIMYHEFEAE